MPVSARSSRWLGDDRSFFFPPPLVSWLCDVVLFDARFASVLLDYRRGVIHGKRSVSGSPPAPAARRTAIDMALGG